MMLNKLKIWVIPKRPFLPRLSLVFGQQHFHLCISFLLLLSSPSPKNEHQCPVRLIQLQGNEVFEHLDLVLRTVPDNPGRAVLMQKDVLQGTEEAWSAGCSGLQPRECESMFKAWKPQALSKCHTSGLFAQVSLQQRGGKGRKKGRLGCCCLAALRASSDDCTSPFCSFPLPRSDSWCGTSSSLL